MTRKVAGAVVVLVAGLACSACGGGSPRATTTMSARPRTVTVQLPVTQRIVKASGAGSKTLRRFTYRGKLSLTLSCTGAGNLNLDVASSPSFPGLATTCPELGDGLGPGTGSGNGAHRAQIRIDAPARVHWTITLRETYPKASTVPAGVQQLPLRRSGVGPESLGTFAMTHGFLYIAATCVGKGTFGIWFNRPELGISGACLNSRHNASVKTVSSGVSERRARIDVSAPGGMKWTVVVFAGPRPSSKPDDPTNVWR